MMISDYSAIGGIITEMKFRISSEFSSCCKHTYNISDSHMLCPQLVVLFLFFLKHGCTLPSGTNTTWDPVPQELKGLVTSYLVVSDE